MPTPTRLLTSNTIFATGVVPFNIGGMAIMSYNNALTFIKTGNKKHPEIETIRDGIATIDVVPYPIKGGPSLQSTNRFYLQNIQINKTEKAVPLESFGESSLFTFDEKSKIFSFSGYVLDSSDIKHQWAAQLYYFYDTFLKGSILKKNRHIARLVIYKNAVYYGYPLQMVFQKSAAMEHLQQFQMSWAIVKEEYPIHSKEDEDDIFRKNFKLDETFEGKYATYVQKDQEITDLTGQLATFEAENNLLVDTYYNLRFSSAVDNPTLIARAKSLQAIIKDTETKIKTLEEEITKLEAELAEMAMRKLPSLQKITEWD